jgi:4'-phosphopantetheinyl transferase
VNVRLWWLRPADAPADAQLAALLSPTEQQHAARFIDVQARRRFLAGRAALRRLLAAESATTPTRVALTVDRFGKPQAAAAPAFNLAHSGAYVLIALADAAVGVDLEQSRPLPDAAALAQRVMTAAEYRAWQRLAAAERSAVLLQLWVAKEALLKCDGRGLTHDPAALQVGLAGGARRVALDGQPLLLQPLPAPQGYLAACAVTQRSLKSHLTWCVRRLIW